METITFGTTLRTNVLQYGGGPRIRTANVYHEGPDLQSGAAHAIAARPPKIGCPGRDRTYDRVINSHLLLPTELLDNKLGAQGGTRTLKTWFLRPVRIPVPSPGQNSGGPKG